MIVAAAGPRGRCWPRFDQRRRYVGNRRLGQRRYDLDWVRIGAFMLLILYHVGMYYVTWDWHVKSPHASARARAAHAAHVAVAAVAAVPGVRRRDRLLARAPRRARVHRQPLGAPARAARVRHARDRAAAVVSRGRREGRSTPAATASSCGLYLTAYRRVLPRRRLPDPADLEPSVVRRVSVGLHAAVVCRRSRRARCRAAAARSG